MPPSGECFTCVCFRCPPLLPCVCVSHYLPLSTCFSSTLKPLVHMSPVLSPPLRLHAPTTVLFYSPVSAETMSRRQRTKGDEVVPPKPSHDMVSVTHATHCSWVGFCEHYHFQDIKHNTRAHIHTHTHTHTHTHACTHAHTRTHTHARTHTQTVCVVTLLETSYKGTE